MKKIGILTINDYENFGNRLQNYAVQEVLKTLGFEVETVVNNSKYTKRNTDTFEKLGKLKKLKKMSFNDIYTKINDKILNKVYKENKLKRFEVFKNFTSSYIKETDYSISFNNIPQDLNQKFDFFVTGSDQVWNPNIDHRSAIDFITFAPRYKRIAFSPSFAVSKIPDKRVDQYKEWISGMASLSVREKAGAKIIKDLTGRDAVVLVDPTLMLTKEKWMTISKKATNKPTKKYLLTYFLGPISKENENKINTIAKDNDLEIINLAQIKESESYKAGPSEFIDFINSASLVCTDSFHGSVFSILLETSFLVFERGGNLPNMNSRIDTLLSTFKLESRLSKNVTNNNQVFEMDYAHVYPILEEERNKAKEYLTQALKIKEEALNIN
ncbi:polysaccharide pyruvyl transferase family protein [Neobacillus sp. 179-C4.2 HS]|uniref:Polysaccharide pyruvyl transferase family protein n=1 Tax=Neobacillus driksii TaxID=3035913 RepID=A0ABV4YZ96_9BACI|nr:polysaccharide pyruvyl transferase family protein [Neobacillus sp. 179.-C4.2 HS]MDP5194623.1 polysaccharide pyruvyl transferase family protein [Neobacillus sp. 179.-C4.2 HS]